MSALTNAILSQYPHVFGGAERPTEHIVVRGRVTRSSDPMFSANKRDILKRMPVSELPLTVTRWLALGRTIYAIEPYTGG